MRLVALLLCTLFSSTAFSVNINCLAEAVFFEAVGEPYAGQAAVVQVIMSRAEHPYYPTKPCDVVKQKRKGVWQFSYLKREDLSIKNKDMDKFFLAQSIVRCVVEKQCYVDSIGKSTVYYACSGKNAIPFPSSWDRSKLTFKAKVGNHCFYEEKLTITKR